MGDKSNRKYIIILVLGLSLPLILISFGELIFISKTNTCGIVLREEKVKGYSYFVVKYLVKGKYYTSNSSSTYFKIKKVEELKKIRCIQVSYSNLYPSFIKIVDEKVGNDQ
jgi:hypothetical protein